MPSQFTTECHSKSSASGRIVLCALLLAASAAAQTKSNTITQPVLGSLFDGQTKTIRGLMGIPADARVGGPIDAGTPLSALAISAERSYALAVEQDTGAAVVVSQSGRQALSGVGAGIAAGALQIAVSPHGTAAALYFGDSGKAVVLTGMPGAPQILRQVTLDGPPAMLAVSDDGAGLAAVVNLANNATVFSYSADGAGQVVLSGRRFPSLEFVPGSGTILMATESAVYLYQSRQGVQLLADQRDGLADVVGAAASGDGALVVIAMRSGQVAVRNVAAATQTLLSCACQPAGMWRLRGNAIFRLNELGAGPLWLVDGGAASSAPASPAPDSPAPDSNSDPRILFVAVPAGVNQ